MTGRWSNRKMGEQKYETGTRTGRCRLPNRLHFGLQLRARGESKSPLSAPCYHPPFLPGCATHTTSEASNEASKTVNANHLPARTCSDSTNAQHRQKNAKAVRISHLCRSAPRQKNGEKKNAIREQMFEVGHWEMQNQHISARGQRSEVG